MHLLRSCKAGGLGVITSPPGFSDTLRNRVSGPLKVALCCKHVHLGGRWAGPYVCYHFKHGWFYQLYTLRLRSSLSSRSSKDKRQPLSTESSTQATVVVLTKAMCSAWPPHFLQPLSQASCPISGPSLDHIQSELLLALKRSLMELAGNSTWQEPQAFRGDTGSNNNKHNVIWVQNQCLL